MGSNHSRDTTASSEDKRWINLNEASLFHRHFIEDHLIELLEHGFGEEEENLIKTETPKLGSIITDNPFQLEFRTNDLEKHNDILHKLTSRLKILTFPIINDEFEIIMNHRKKMIHRIYLAYQKESERKASSKNSCGRPTPPENTSLEKIGTKVFIPLISLLSDKDPSIVLKSLELISNFIEYEKTEPLSLSDNAQSESVQTWFNWLVSLTKKNIGPNADLSNLRLALENVYYLCISTGSLNHILVFIELLLQICEQTPHSNLELKLNYQPLEVDETVHPLDLFTNLKTQFKIALPPDIQLKGKISITVDESFIYFLVQGSNLLTCGKGYHGTVPGQIYKHVKLQSSIENGNIAYINKKLYCLFGSQLRIFDPNSLIEINSFNLTFENPSEETLLTTEGRYLYVCYKITKSSSTEESGEDIEFFVEKFDPIQPSIPRIKTIQLKPGILPIGNKVLVRNTIQEACIFTNGDELCFVFPPSSEIYSQSKHFLRLFSLQDGVHKKDSPNSLIGVPTCFDSFHPFTWNLLDDEPKISPWKYSTKLPTFYFEDIEYSSSHVIEQTLLVYPEIKMEKEEKKKQEKNLAKKEKEGKLSNQSKEKEGSREEKKKDSKEKDKSKEKEQEEKEEKEEKEFSSKFINLPISKLIGFILAHMDRLGQNIAYHISGIWTSVFCLEMFPETFSVLNNLLGHLSLHLDTTLENHNSDTPILENRIYFLVVILRILELNIRSINERSCKIEDTGLSLEKDNEDCLILQIRKKLLYILEITNFREQSLVHRVVNNEICKIFVNGLDILFPTAEERHNFILTRAMEAQNKGIENKLYSMILKKLSEDPNLSQMFLKVSNKEKELMESQLNKEDNEEDLSFNKSPERSPLNKSLSSEEVSFNKSISSEESPLNKILRSSLSQSKDQKISNSMEPSSSESEEEMHDIEEEENMKEEIEEGYEGEDKLENGPLLHDLEAKKAQNGQFKMNSGKISSPSSTEEIPYESLHSNQLFLSILSFTKQCTINSLYSLKNRKSTFPDSIGLPPTLKFLLSFQKDLLRRVYVTRADSNSYPSRALVEYVDLILEKNKEILEYVFQEFFTKKGNISSLMPAVLSELDQILKNSILCALSLPLFSCLTLLTKYVSLNKVNFTHFLQSLDNFNNSVPSILKNESKTNKRVFPKHSVLCYETSHPYRKGVDEERKIHFPKAACIMIYFDPRSDVHRNDPVRIKKGDKKEVLGEYHENNWPKYPLVVRADTVYLCFTVSEYSSSTLWGYKIHFMPIYVPEYDEPWSLELEKIIASLVSKIFEELLPQEKIDEQYLKWIESSLIAPGMISPEHLPSQKVKEYNYLKEQMNLDQGSQDEIKPEIQSAVRAIFVAFLKESELTSLVMSHENPSNLNQVDYFWKSAKKIQTWMIKQYQEMKENSMMEGEEIYKILTSEVIAKVNLLLRIASPVLMIETPVSSFFSVPSFSRNLSHSTSSITVSPILSNSGSNSKKRPFDDTSLPKPKIPSKRSKTSVSPVLGRLSIPIKEQEEDIEDFPLDSKIRAIQKIKQLATTLQALQRWKSLTSNFQSPSDITEKHSKIVKSVMNFIQSGIQTEQLIQIITQRNLRATDEAQFLESIQHIFSQVHFISVKSKVIKFFYKSFGFNSHYSDNLKGCNVEVSQNIHLNFHNLLSSMISILKSSLAEDSLKIQICQALALKYHASDYILLEKFELLDSLYEIFTQESNSTSNSPSVELTQAAWTTFCLLTTSLWSQKISESGELHLENNHSKSGMNNNGSMNSNDNHLLTSCNNLKKKSLDIIFHQLKFMKSYVSQIPLLRKLDLKELIGDIENKTMQSISQERSTHKIDEHEHYCFELLSLLLLISRIAPQHHLSLPFLSDDLLSFLDGGSPRIQRVVLSLLQEMFSFATSDTLEPILTHFLEIVGEDLYKSLLYLERKEPSHIKVSTGSSPTLIVQIVMLLRRLQFSEIQPYFVNLIHRSLRQGTMVLTSNLPENVATFGFLGAIRVLGLEESVIRTGGKVEVIWDEFIKETGLVIHCSTQFGIAKVLFEKFSENKIQDVEISQVQPISEVSIDPSLFKFTAVEFQPLLAILRSTETIGTPLFHSELKYLICNSLSILLNHIPSFKCFASEGGIELLLHFSSQPRPFVDFSLLDLGSIQTLKEGLFKVQERLQNPCPIQDEKETNRESIPHYSLPFVDILPTNFNETQHIKFLNESLTSFQYTGEGKSQIAAPRGNLPIPSSSLIYYFECKIDDEGEDKSIAVGFISLDFHDEKDSSWLPGTYTASYGFHGHDGQKYVDGISSTYSESYGTGDVIGCCLYKIHVDANYSIFFTKNGKKLETAFSDILIEKQIYPVVGVHSKNSKCTANFGQFPFAFDIKSFWENKMMGEEEKQLFEKEKLKSSTMEIIEKEVNTKQQIEDIKMKEEQSEMLNRSNSILSDPPPLRRSSARMDDFLLPEDNLSEEGDSRYVDWEDEYEKDKGQLNLKMVKSGMYLMVTEMSLFEEWQKYINAIGLVERIHFNSQRILLSFQDNETGKYEAWWFPIKSLQIPKGKNLLWTHLNRQGKQQSQKLAIDLLQAISFSTCRLILTQLFSPSTLHSEVFSDYFSRPYLDQWFTTLKLLTCEHIAVPLEIISKPKIFDNKASRFFKNKTEMIPKASSFSQSINFLLEKLLSTDYDMGLEAVEKYILAVLEQCFNLNVARTEESPHPFKNLTKFTKEIKIEGARKLYVWFDKECYVDSGFEIHLPNLRDKAFLTYKGKKTEETFQSFLIDGDSFSYCLNSGNSQWGFKFYVIVASEKLSTAQALVKPNFDFVWWTLTSILQNPKLQVLLQTSKTLEILTKYLSAPRSLFRIPVMRWLTNLMLLPLENKVQLNFELFQPIYKHLLTLRKDNLNSSPYSVYFQNLTELCVQILLKKKKITGVIELNLEKEFKLGENIPDLRWLVQELEATEIIRGFSETRTFPHSFVLYGFCDLYTVPIEVETPHPYGKMVKKNVISFPNAQSILIRFDPNSSTYVDDVLTITADNSAKESHSFSAKEFQNKSEILIDANKISYSFIIENTQYYFSTSCDHCLNSISRTRFKCLTCGMNSCANCLDLEDCSDHVFLKIKNPVPDEYEVDDLEANENLLISDGGEVHENTQCDGCKISPIVGIKFKCAHCDLQLCSNCEKNPPVTHDPKHIFFQLNRPLISGDLPIISFYQEFYWGFKFYAIPILNKDGINEIYKAHTQHLEQLLNEMNNIWTVERDDQLLHLINQTFEKTGQPGLSLLLSEFPQTTEDLANYPALQNVELDQIRARFGLFRNVNRELTEVIRCVDFTHLSDFCFAKILCQTKHLVFLETKMFFWNSVISHTHFARQPSVKLNRRNAANEENKDLLFLQAFRQIANVKGSRLRSLEKGFHVEFQGEGAEDAGGPYRDAIQQFAEEIQSKDLPLFIPSPNSVNNVGNYRDRVIPNPAKNSPSDLAMFNFVGKLLGITLRTKGVFPLNLPSLIWKPIVGQKIERTDLENVDQVCFQSLDTLRNIELEGVTKENFSDVIDFSFTTTSSDGREIELVEEGKKKSVTWENRHEYIELIEQYKEHEFDLQVAALVAGITTIIPYQLFYLMTWKEAEARILGNSGFSIESLKQRAEYHGFTENDAVIKNFWKVLENFSSQDKSTFLKFVWGRTSLPVLASEFNEKFVIQAFPKKGDPDTYLPEAHTCFFTLDLPRYSTLEILEQKLKYAIYNTKEIDTDYVPYDYY